MSRPVKHGTFRRHCRTCGWSNTFTTAGRADYAKSKHSCERHLRLAEARGRGEARMERVDRAPKSCPHPKANGGQGHVHGTYACYTLDACRCLPCKKAQREYEQNRIRQQAYGRWDNLVDAEPVRAHVNFLREQGMGAKRIAALAGISTGSMSKLLYGHYAPTGTGKSGGRYGKGQLDRGPAKRVRKETAEKLLAVRLELSHGNRVDGADTARRLQALVANGWSISKLGRRLGITPANMTPLVRTCSGRSRDTVTVATAKAVHALYAELADVAPPAATHRDKIAASRARRYAQEHGWAPPLRINGRLLLGSALPRETDRPTDRPTGATTRPQSSGRLAVTGS